MSDESATTPPAGGGTVFTEPVLVVNQKVQILETAAEHTVMDRDGTVIGSVAEVEQSQLKKAARLVSGLDQFMTHVFEIRDANQQPLMKLTRPRKFMKSSFRLERADDSPIGEIRQKNRMGKIKFELAADGDVVGLLKAENWAAWNFTVLDAADREVARIDKTWAGLGAEVFTTADNYAIEMKEQLTEPLLSLVVASSLCVDTALKQDSGGLLK